MQESILQSVGKTPLVRLQRVTEGLSVKIYAKVESQNPGGSVKDRVADLPSTHLDPGVRTH